MKKIGIDVDGVLRDFIPDLISSIKETELQLLLFSTHRILFSIVYGPH